PPPTEALPNSRLKKRIAPPSIAGGPATVEPKRNREASRCRCGARGLPMLLLGGRRPGKADNAPGEGNDRPIWTLQGPEVRPAAATHSRGDPVAAGPAQCARCGRPPRAGRGVARYRPRSRHVGGAPAR